MSPLNHLQYGWLMANLRDYDRRERRLIMLSALLMDLDGIFILLAPILGIFRLDPVKLEMLENLHHSFSHNIFFAGILGLVFGLFNRRRRLEMMLVCAGAGLLQVALDNLTNDPSWPIMYFWPVSKFDFGLGNFIVWPHLRVLTVWGLQGFFSVLIWGSTIMIYLRTGRTFLELVSENFDKFITNFITLPLRGPCSRCGNRGHYRCQRCGQEFCIEHCGIQRNLSVICEECLNKK